MRPSTLLALSLLGASVSPLPAQSRPAPQVAAIRNRAPLVPNAFDPLPLGSIEPTGWLRNQLEIQARGLSGHLDEFWPDLMPSNAWKGGDGDAWERGPYFADGLLPLAYQLHDPALIQKANSWVEWTLTHQRPDGQIGPASNDDWWPRMVMLKVLTQYQEVTGDPRVVPLMARYFSYELRTLPDRPLRDWGKYRWQDNALTVLWLYNRTGDPKLLDLARLLRTQGFDWKSSFEHFPFTAPTSTASLGLKDNQPIPERAMQAHGVNNAMALKAGPVSYTLSGTPSDRSSLYQQVGELERYHLLPIGLYSGDEHLAGDNPSQGVELCTVVESMFSWEDALSVLGDARFSDRLERISFNALPGTLSDDMWSHQYDQQPNQVSCTRAPRQWSTNGPDSNLFGLEPHFGCCTANFHQGWPKFTSALWMSTPDGGLLAAAYAPNRLHTTVGPRHTPVSIDEDTEYPFRGTVRLTLHPARPTQMPLVVRIPGWATEATLTINKEQPQTIHPSCPQQPFDGRLDVSAQSSPDTCLFHTLRRRWRAGDTVTLTFPTQPRVTRWYHRSAAVERGPLLFSLKMDQNWTELKQHPEKSADWEIQSDSPWNYALALDPSDPSHSLTVHELPLGPVPFSSAAPPLTITLSGALDPNWKLFENSAGPLPESPVTLTETPTLLTLIPYAAAKLRITAFPILNPAQSAPKTAAAPPQQPSTPKPAL